MSRRRRLLFVTPVVPAEGGNGLAMRAGLFLDAFAADHEVSLLVVPVSGAPAAAWPSFVVARTAQRVCLELAPFEDPAFRAAADDDGRQVAALRAYPRPALARFSVAAAVQAVRRRLAPDAFDAVHVLRLYLAPFVDAASGRPRTVLDLDDDEVETRRRLAALHAARGEAARMTLEAAEADKYRDVERAWIERFDALLVGSERDRAAVIARTGHPRIHVVPNGVPRAEPATVRPDAGDRCEAPFRLLFVGTLGYLPNVDAATTLCREVLPRLRARGPREVTVDLVGARPAPAVMALAGLVGVRLHADVAHVAPFYEQADAAVVPLRAGGGTRIKLLEAFAHGVPVVSTPVGAEGLDVEPGRHVLIADDADGLAEACGRLMDDPRLADRLRAEALRLVAARYDAGRIATVIRRVMHEGRAPRGPHGARRRPGGRALMRRRRTKSEEEHLARGLDAFLEALEAAPSSTGMSARFLQDMEILTACPVCGSPDIARAFLPDAARCHGCGVYFRNPRPTQARIIRAYDAGTTFARWEEEQPVRDRLWRRRLRILVRHAGSGGLLDVGTGDGHFLDFARTRFHVTGTDVSTAAAEYARRRGRHVRLGALDAQAFAAAAFDVITLWHVLEHVAEPGRMLATVRGLLRPGGILVVAVPNEARALAIHRLKRLLGLGARWTPFGALHPAGEIHLTQFVAGTLETAVRRAGFAILESGVDDVNVDDTVMGALDFHVQHLLHRVAGRHLGRAIYMICRRS